MDYQEYRRKNFTDPQPQQRYKTRGIHGATLYYQDYQAALHFFKEVFGPPAYVEGQYTHGWRIGDSWLTVFPAKQGNPQNLEVPIYLQAADEVDRLYAAFVAAGAQGTEPQETLMYLPVRIALVTDPFGVMFTLVFEDKEKAQE